jgi:ATP-binding cassette subfamily B protein
MMQIMIKTAPLFLVLTVIFSIISGLGNVAQSYLLSKIIDGVIADFPFVTITVYAVIIIIFQFMTKLQNRTLFSLNRVVTEEIGLEMERGVLKTVDTIKLQQMDDPAFLNKLEQARTLTKRSPNSIFMIIFGLVSMVSASIGFFVILSKISILYVIILIIGSVLLFIANNRYEENVLSFLFSMSPERRKMNYISDLLTKRDNFEEIHSYQAAGYFRSLFDREADKQIRKSWLIFKKYSWVYTASALLSYVSCAFVYILIIKKAVDGIVSIGDTAMFLTACLGFQAVLTELIDGACSLPPELIRLQNYRDFIKMTDNGIGKAIPERTKVSFCKTDRVLDVRNLTFTYPGTEKKVLNDVSFSLKNSESAALVGLNGSGKTTLVRLIAGFYDEYIGHILINGQETREMAVEERARTIAILYQNYLKPSLPLIDAVTYKECDEEMRSKALDVLQKSGYETQDPDVELTKLYTSKGTIPSGGQWQKIALARILYRDVKMYILDEPSAALDPQAEDEMFKIIENLRTDHSIIYITHRLGSVLSADTILYLSPEGKLVQSTHSTLMNTNSEYKKLYLAQADKYRTQ